MSTAAPNSIKELFLHARELAAPERAAFLAQACGEDAALRRRIEALVRAETALGDDALAPAPTISPTPDEIDRYELLDVLGEGGFGTVYRARRRSGVQGEVAIKVLRAGAEAGAALARFGDEQRSLEAMDHPGIARVLDAGATATGRPFIVMELVRGEAITDFCRRAHLSVAARVALMAEVCRAVQHAHSKGVIHRDLKPSNILAWEADGRAWAKVIDFGIAKVLEGSRPAAAGGTAAITRAMELIGTPAYMSPEQARGAGADLDTRADVYALGAVLYEVLSAQPVIDPAALAPASPGAVERLICEVVPPPPSARALAAASDAPARREARHLRGELDWVTMRAIEKDPARRYPTAEALADDLDRAARGEAVFAGPPSRLYRLSRLMKREKGLFAGLAAALLALSIGAGLAITMGLRAVAAEKQSERERQVAEAINTFVRDDLLSAVKPGVGSGRGRDVKMREVLDEAARRMERAGEKGGSLEGQPLVQAGVRATLSNTYFALGEFRPALEQAEAAYTLYRGVQGPHSRAALRTRLRVGYTLQNMGRFHDAADVFQDVYDASLRLWGEHDPVSLDALEAIASVNTWGLFDRDRSISLGRQVYQLRKDGLGPDDPTTLWAGYSLGVALFFAERWPEAEDLLKDVMARRTRVLGELDPGTLAAEFFLIRCRVRMHPGRFDANEAALLDVLRRSRGVYGEQHRRTLAIEQDLGDLYLRNRLYWRALMVLEPQYNVKRATLGDDHIDTVTAESSVGYALAMSGLREQGLALLRDAITRQERLPRREAPGLPDAYRRFILVNNDPD